MSSVTPSPSTVLQAFDTLGPPGTPMTTSEIADEFDSTPRAISDKLETLVDEEILETKQVGTHGQVWWQPLNTIPVKTAVSLSDKSRSKTQSSREDLRRTQDLLELPEREPLYHEIFNQMFQFIGLLEPDGTLVEANEAALSFGGVDRKDVIGELFWKAPWWQISEHAQTQLKTAIDRAADGEFVQYEVEVQGADRTAVVDFSLRPVTNDQGTVTFLIPEGRDITDLKQRERQLEQQAQSLEQQRDKLESELADVFERISDGFIGLDESFRFTYVNDHAESLLEIDESSVRAHDIRETLVLTDQFETALQEALDEQNPVSIEDYYEPLGTWFETTLYPSKTGVSVYFRDVSERKQRERQLEESERRYQTLVENFPNGVVALVDGDMRCITFGGSLEGDTEISRENIEGEFLHHVLPQEISNVVIPQYETALAGEPSEFEETIDDKVYRFHFVPIRDEDGDVFAALGMSQNITTSKKRENELKQYEALVETVTDGIVVVDTDFQIRAVNEALVEMTSYPRESLVGAPASLIRPDTLSPIMNQVQSSLDRGTKTEVVETMIQPADDDPFPSITHFARITLDDGTPGRVGVIRDISDQLEREQALEESERRYRTLVDNSPDMIDILNSEGTLLDVNQRLCTELGYAEAELVGKSIWEFDQSIDAERVSTLLSELSVDEPRTFDARYQRSDGSTFPVEVNLVRLDLEGQDRFMAISRDISERLKRERQLRDRVRQQEIVTELGKTALKGNDIDQLMADATALVAETLDNDYCKVLDLDQDAKQLLLRQGVGWDEGIVGSATVSSVEDDSQAAYTLSSQKPIRVEDLATENRFSGPDLLTSHGVRSGISAIIGSHENPWGILGTHDTEPKEISEQDVNFVQSVANILATAINRHEREQTVHHQREQLAELNNINEVVREITEAVINQSTREEIEEIVCKRLAEAESYEFAWIGDIDIHSQTLTPRTEAGVEGYLDEITISVLPDDPRGAGPAGEAVRTRKMQVIHDALVNPEFESWNKYPKEYSYRSVAAIPISYDGTLYGVLGVYADRPKAFDGEVCEVIARLGEIVGHAIAATERKQALMNPEVTEIQYVVPDVLDTMGISSDVDGRITFDRAVPIGGDTFLEYGTVDETAIETLEALVDQSPHAEEVTITSRGKDTTSQFELRVSEPPIISTVAAHGGYLQQTKIEDGDFHITIHLPPTVAVRQVVDVIRETYPTANLLTRRQVTRSDDMLSRVQQTYTEDLTERQRSALETAVYSGFFEWPRNETGEELAATLGISPPTFHQHLRLAQKKVFESLLDTPSV